MEFFLRQRGGIVKNIFKRKPSDFPTEYTVTNALKKGDLLTKLSFIILGAGNIARKQIVKGIMFLLVEVAYIYYMFADGFFRLSELATIGSYKSVETWNEKKGIFEYTITGTRSINALLFAVLTIILTLLFIAFWRECVKSAYKVQCLTKEGKHVNSFKDEIADLFNMSLHKLLLTLPITGVLTFTILPLVFMILMAFTNYSTVNDKLVKFEWTGLEAFKEVINLEGTIGKQFWSVLLWTIVWAIFATVLNYIMGMILALVINRKGTRLKGMWRFFFILSIAVPQFVSLLIVRTLLNENGAINMALLDWGWIKEPLPFWTDATWARVTVIIVNCWVGIPYTMLTMTGILQNIPADLYEAARVDGANAIVTFFKITLPYMLFVTMPSLITTFTGNINNFNVIYLLSGGGPTNTLGHTAGDTDLLVTWLYKLTIDRQEYNIGAVIGIFTFVVLAIVSLVTYRNTNSYKDEEGFQ
jgi:arabinogalactan oligomer/maltooligosaccharide transport system permease protein